MTPAQLSHLRQLLDEATPGPWCVHPNGTSAWQGEEYDRSGVLPDHGMVLRAALCLNERALADLELVVELRNHAAELIEAAEKVLSDG